MNTHMTIKVELTQELRDFIEEFAAKLETRKSSWPMGDPEELETAAVAVAWQYRTSTPQGGWSVWIGCDRETAERLCQKADFDVRALYPGRLHAPPITGNAFNLPINQPMNLGLMLAEAHTMAHNAQQQLIEAQALTMEQQKRLFSYAESATKLSALVLRFNAVICQVEFRDLSNVNDFDLAELDKISAELGALMDRMS